MPSTVSTERRTTSPSAAGFPRPRVVSIEAPWNWLASGWQDLWSAPLLSLGYGALFAFMSLVLAAGLFELGWQAAIPALAGGFLLVGPLLAVGPYEISRRLESGEAIDIRDVLLVGVRSPAQLAQMGVLLVLAYLVWIDLALLLFMLFMGAASMPTVESFTQIMLFTPAGLGLVLTGTAIGALIAATIFALTVVSVPLLMVWRTDIVSAVLLSIATVASNYRPMMLWAALIVGMMVLGFLTLLLGLIVIFPLIGHATWHAFRDLVDLPLEPVIVSDVTHPDD
jgi:uncharacterized membrane protein